MSHLYLHIPYCATKCPYCDFFSRPIEELPAADRYIDELVRRMERLEERFETVYVGGGTPSELPQSAIDRLTAAVADRLAPNAEWTWEANPAGFPGEQADLLRARGVTRLSLGTQSASDLVLERLGRRHRHIDNIRALAVARAASFASVSGDLIFGLPDDDLDGSIDFLLSSGVSHVSCYELTIEGRSKWNMQNFDPSQSDEEKLEKLERIIERLGAAGIRRYEISNFARPGHECRSHLNVWHSGAYVGIGAGAHGFDGDVRYHYQDDVAAFLSGTPPETDRVEHLAAETMMLGMRLPGGIELARLPLPRRQALAEARPTLERLAAEGAIEILPDRIRPTARGLKFVNDLAAALI